MPMDACWILIEAPGRRVESRNFIGLTGLTGEMGIKGDMGLPGEKGEQGPPGSQGMR